MIRPDASDVAIGSALLVAFVVAGGLAAAVGSVATAYALLVWL